MIPDIQLQLKATNKSLKDNILPAIDPTNELAQQQIQLAIATLEMVQNNLPVIHQVLRKDIQQHIVMAEDMLDALSNPGQKKQLDSLIRTAQSALGDPETGFTQLQDAARELRSGLGDIIKTCTEDDADTIEALVLNRSESSLMLGRSLNIATGFETSPDDVPGIGELLR